MEKKKIYFTSDPEEVRMHLEKLYTKIANHIKIQDSVKNKQEKSYLIKTGIMQKMKILFQLHNLKKI